MEWVCVTNSLMWKQSSGCFSPSFQCRKSSVGQQSLKTHFAPWASHTPLEFGGKLMHVFYYAKPPIPPMDITLIAGCTARQPVQTLPRQTCIQTGRFSPKIRYLKDFVASLPDLKSWFKGLSFRKLVSFQRYNDL